MMDNINQSLVQTSMVPSTMEATSSMEGTQTQLESESLSEKADLERDEKEKLSDLLASCGSGEHSLSIRGAGENIISSSAGDFSSPICPYTNATSTSTTKSLNIPLSQISTSTITTPSLPLSNASNIPVVSNATNVINLNINAVPNVSLNVGSDTNLTAAIPDSNVEASTVMNVSTTNISTPGAMSMQFNQPSTAPATPMSSAPAAVGKNCEYLNTCARFKSFLGLPGKNTVLKICHTKYNTERSEKEWTGVTGILLCTDDALAGANGQSRIGVIQPHTFP